MHGDSLDAPAHELTRATAMAHDHGIALWTWNPDIARIPDYRTLGVTRFCVDDVRTAVVTLNGLR